MRAVRQLARFGGWGPAVSTTAPTLQEWARQIGHLERDHVGAGVGCVDVEAGRLLIGAIGGEFVAHSVPERQAKTVTAVVAERVKAIVWPARSSTTKETRAGPGVDLTALIGDDQVEAWLRAPKMTLLTWDSVSMC